MESKIRQSLYDQAGKLNLKPVNATSPENHTMGPDNFRRYIGTYNRTNYDLDTKKFGEVQSNLIRDAYTKGHKIIVIGAYREDLKFLLSKNKAKKIGSIIEHTKPGLFNCRRQVMCEIQKTETNENELWVTVFPSKHYVDQIAQLIKSIITEFSLKNEPSSTKVEVAHFPTLECRISEWTGFEDFISLFVRHGDVVIIGNVDLILPGLAQYSFISQGDSFFEGGLDNMFGAKLLIHQHSFSRIVLIGVKESYWGDASAQYVQSIIESGAMHILYGSKAATMVQVADVHATYSPGYFKLVNDNGHIEDIEYFCRDISNLYSNLDIKRTNFAITVPTVIGESHEQRIILLPEGPTCMDCEDGHIAKTIAEHNRIISKGGSTSITSEDFKKTFFPIHFITDYIYHSQETPKNGTSSLGTHANEDDDYKIRRNLQFLRIGNVFAAYSLMFARQNLKNKFEKINLKYSINEDSYDAQFTKIRPLLTAGLGQQAIAVLTADTTGILELGVNKATVLAIICQKEGYIDSAHTLIEKLSEKNIREKMSEEHRIQVDVIALKVYSQIGSIDRATKLIANLNVNTKQSILKKNVKQFGAVKRREAIWNSLQNKPDQAYKCIEIAIDDESNRHDPHYKYTNILFKYIAMLSDINGYSNEQLRKISQNLSEVRTAYLTSDPNENVWQTNFEKGAIAALYLESAYYLKTREDTLIKKGAYILAIAHFFNLWFGGNEASETYGEIVACSRDFKVKNIISLSMRQDSKSQFLFQKWYNSKFNNLSEIAENFTQIFRLNIIERENEIQKLISKFD